MLTIKIMYSSGAVRIEEAREFFASADGLNLHYDSPTGSAEVLDLDGTETVYVVNEAGRTVHTIKGIPA